MSGSADTTRSAGVSSRFPASPCVFSALIRVAMAPGAMALMRMRCPASSCARVRIISAMPPFEAA